MTRRERIEAMLAAAPGDAFLRYALATERLAEGDHAGGVAGLSALAEEAPDYHAAHFRLAQALHQAGEEPAAAGWLRRGIAAADRLGDAKAAGEMRQLLDMLE